MSWNPSYAILILLSTVITWATGLVIDKQRCNGKKTVRNAAFVFCILINLAILFLFKYLDFFIDSFNKVLWHLNISLISNPFDLLLPVGISFYTFQALGYLIDVYRGTRESEHNILKYALFVSFFPQLVAGPIERSEHLLNQIRESRQVKRENTYQQITDGLIYMIYGFFLKLVIADRVAIMVNTVWESWYLYGGVELLVAAIGFAVQIYCDFSGYSTIAIGAAKVMGFELMENFDAPYFSQSIKEFWKRWHISLSTWLRDYIYIPLGGSRCSKIKKYRNLLITFLISGLWHGANWTFVVWGGLHAVFQILGDATHKFREKIYPMIGIRIDSLFYKMGRMITTFFLADLAWIFFRSASISDAIGFIKNIVLLWDPWAIWDQTLYQIGLSNYEWNILLISILIMAFVDVVRYRQNKTIDAFLDEQGAMGKGVAIVVMIMMIFIYGIYGAGYDASQFIYFQF
jgi:D-alanyl-lipoteichoic acid acyltransferase DltB (MBOAT superfamily)